MGLNNIEISGHPVALVKLACQACFAKVFDVQVSICCQSGVAVGCGSGSWCLVSIQYCRKHPLEGPQQENVPLGSCVYFGFYGVLSRALKKTMVVSCNHQELLLCSLHIYSCTSGHGNYKNRSANHSALHVMNQTEHTSVLIPT